MKSLDLSLFSLCFFSFFSFLLRWFLLWDWFCLSKLSRDGRDGHQHQQAPPPQPPTDVFQCNKLPTSETKKPKLFTQNLCSWIIHLLRVIDFVRSLPELRKQRGCVGCQAFGASRPLLSVDVFFFWNWAETPPKGCNGCIYWTSSLQKSERSWYDFAYLVTSIRQICKSPSTVNATSG